MYKLTQAVIEQDIEFLKENLTPENVNTIYDFSVVHTMNVHLSNGTERSDFYNEDEKGTLLHLTAWYNLPVSAKFLIEKGADINEGRTPLEVAANSYDVITYPVQRVLIENGADVNMKAKDGESILEFAEENNGSYSLTTTDQSMMEERQYTVDSLAESDYFR